MPEHVEHGENGLTWIVVTDDDNEPEARIFITTSQLATRYNQRRVDEALGMVGIRENQDQLRMEFPNA